MDGMDDLKRCQVCGEPTEAYWSEDKLAALRKFNPNCSDRHRRLCACERQKREEEKDEQVRSEHRKIVERLKKNCFGRNRIISESNFENLAAECSGTVYCKSYLASWKQMRDQNIGMLLWGDVGTGKSSAAAGIANALIEKEIPVCMRGMGDILNMGFDEREEFLKTLEKYELLIIDDFGMERSTEFGLETSFRVIDTRYQTGKPLIVTTNLSINVLNNPDSLERKRIYDRIQTMCVAVKFDGPNLREAERIRKQDQFRRLIVDTERRGGAEDGRQD